MANAHSKLRTNKHGIKIHSVVDHECNSWIQMTTNFEKNVSAFQMEAQIQISHQSDLVQLQFIWRGAFQCDSTVSYFL